MWSHLNSCHLVGDLQLKVILATGNWAHLEQRGVEGGVKQSSATERMDTCPKCLLLAMAAVRSWKEHFCNSLYRMDMWQYRRRWEQGKSATGFERHIWRDCPIWFSNKMHYFSTWSFLWWVKWKKHWFFFPHESWFIFTLNYSLAPERNTSGNRLTLLVEQQNKNRSTLSPFWTPSPKCCLESWPAVHLRPAQPLW